MGGYLSRDTGEAEELRTTLAELQKQLDTAAELATSKDEQITKLQAQADEVSAQNEILARDKAALAADVAGAQKEAVAAENKHQAELVRAHAWCAYDMISFC